MPLLSQTRLNYTPGAPSSAQLARKCRTLCAVYEAFTKFTLLRRFPRNSKLCSRPSSLRSLRPLDITNFSMNFTHTADVNAQHLQRTLTCLVSVYRPLGHAAAVLIITYVLLTCTNVWQDQVVARKHVIAQGQVICSLGHQEDCGLPSNYLLARLMKKRVAAEPMNHVIAVSCLSSLFSKRIRSFPNRKTVRYSWRCADPDPGKKKVE